MQEMIQNSKGLLMTCLKVVLLQAAGEQSACLARLLGEVLLLRGALARYSKLY